MTNFQRDLSQSGIELSSIQITKKIANIKQRYRERFDRFRTGNLPLPIQTESDKLIEELLGENNPTIDPLVFGFELGAPSSTALIPENPPKRPRLEKETKTDIYEKQEMLVSSQIELIEVQKDLLKKQQEFVDANKNVLVAIEESIKKSDDERNKVSDEIIRMIQLQSKLLEKVLNEK